MTTLKLGVVDIPYAGAPGSKGQTSQTTGDVAEILEAKYGVMAYFADRHTDDIAGALTEAVEGSLENLMMGAPPSNDPFGAATGKIEQMFRKFLDDEEMRGQPGVPTKAAQRGINHRLARPYAHENPRRPSFIDTGLYQNSFTAWIE